MKSEDEDIDSHGDDDDDSHDDGGYNAMAALWQ
jgi:hypothetical protein